MSDAKKNRVTGPLLVIGGKERAIAVEDILRLLKGTHALYPENADVAVRALDTLNRIAGGGLTANVSHCIFNGGGLKTRGSGLRR